MFAVNNSFPAYLFHEGTNYHSYQYLGVNHNFCNGIHEYIFRVWAPNADKVGLISDFSGWETPLFLKKVTTNGIYELIYSSRFSLERKAYKYRIFCKNEVTDKGDPYARFSKGGNDGASLVFSNQHFIWSDEQWLQKRRESIAVHDNVYLPCPINIYELHLGSFMRHFDNRYYSYIELSEILPRYLKEHGYTHVEFLPVQEHPYDGSWGYQVCGFYAPTSRFGDPNEFKHLINALHSNGIGVIIDWVCAHFANDSWGLSKFDGSCLYESKEKSSWGTSFFDFSKPEVRSFLISNALYFLREFHIDGLRVDAVSSIIYNQTSDAAVSVSNSGIEYIKKLNSAIHGEFPDVLIIAEESTNYGKTTHHLPDGGLGFSMKWNMGWSNDFYDYIATDPIFRRHKHIALTFPIHYAFKEKYCLTVSHDDVVHCKQQLIEKSFGSIEEKFLTARLSLMLMMTYPGKKLLFMGTEFAQFREWNCDNELEWFMLDFHKHSEFNSYIKALNHFYLSSPELWDIDFDKSGFEWVIPDESEKNTLVFNRISKSGNKISIALNFSGVDQEIKIPAKNAGGYKVIFATNENLVSNNINSHFNYNGFFSKFTLPKLSGIIIRANE